MKPDWKFGDVIEKERPSWRDRAMFLGWVDFHATPDAFEALFLHSDAGSYKQGQIVRWVIGTDYWRPVR